MYIATSNRQEKTPKINLFLFLQSNIHIEVEHVCSTLRAGTCTDKKTGWKQNFKLTQENWNPDATALSTVKKCARTNLWMVYWLPHCICINYSKRFARNPRVLLDFVHTMTPTCFNLCPSLPLLQRFASPSRCSLPSTFNIALWPLCPLPTHDAQPLRFQV